MKKKIILSFMIMTLGLSLAACTLDDEISQGRVERTELQYDEETDDSVSDNVSNNEVTPEESVSEDDADTFEAEDSLSANNIPKEIADAVSENIIPEIPVIVPVDNSHLENMGEIMACISNLEYYHTEPDSYIKNLDMFEISKQIIGYSTYDFSQTKITFLGDSLTYGSGGTEKEDGTRVNYTDFLSSMLKCDNIVNLAYPGSTVGAYGGGVYVDTQVYKVPTDSDIIVVMIGVNDFISYNDYYGPDFTTPGYYKYYCEKLMNDLRSKCPNADIFFVTTYRNREESDRYIDHSIANHISLESFMNVQRELAPKYDVHMIDLYHQGFMDNKDDQTYHEFFTDILHPDDDGSRILGKYLAGQIIAYYYKEAFEASLVIN